MTYPEPYAEDINVTTREIFNLFMERNKHVDKIERWG